MGFLKRNGKKIGAALLSTVMFFLCSGLLYVTKLANSVQRIPEADMELAVNQNLPQVLNPNLLLETVETMEDYWNIAIFGVDSREGSLGKGNNSDTQIICVIEKNSGAIKLVSVYRDTFLQKEEKTQAYGKISGSYMDGGPAGNVKALNQNLDLNITDYVSFNWKAAADAVNLLGGVDIEITKEEWKYLNTFITETAEKTGVPSSHLDADGWNHLDGVQAVAYCRLRLMDTDMERTRRQRDVMEQVFEKFKTSDWVTINQVLTTVLPQIATSIDHGDLIEIAKDIKRFHIDVTDGFPSNHTIARMGRNGECLLPNTLETNVQRLHQVLYGVEDYQCSEQVKMIDKEILKQALKN